MLALKGGATSAGARAAASHTAALASSDVAVDALFRQAGVPANAHALGVPRRGGPALVAAAAAGRPRGDPDECRRARDPLCRCVRGTRGLELPEPSPTTRAALRLVLPSEASLENPIDVLGSATAETFASVLPLLLADPAFDAVCVLFVRPIVATAADVVDAVDAAIEAAGHEKPFVGVFLFRPKRKWQPGRQQPGCRFGSHRGSRARHRRAARRAAWLRQPVGVVPELDGIDRDAARAIAAEALEDGNDLWLDARASRTLLETYGIRLAPEALADTPTLRRTRRR